MITIVPRRLRRQGNLHVKEKSARRRRFLGGGGIGSGVWTEERTRGARGVPADWPTATRGRQGNMDGEEDKRRPGFCSVRVNGGGRAYAPYTCKRTGHLHDIQMNEQMITARLEDAVHASSWGSGRYRDNSYSNFFLCMQPSPMENCARISSPLRQHPSAHLSEGHPLLSGFPIGTDISSGRLLRRRRRPWKLPAIPT